MLTLQGLGKYEEHRFSRVIPGDVDTVRDRVSDALEKLKYVVLGGNPLQAKRDRLTNVFVAGVLEYRATLTVAFKRISSASTLATFDYAVEYLFTKGDRLTLEREAEAVIALTLAASRDAVCFTCGEENNPDVRFCRACGTPVARHILPPEVEIMRLTAEANAARQELALGLIIGLLTLAICLPVVLLTQDQGAEIAWAMFGLGALGELIAGFFLLHGIGRLGRTLKPGVKQNQELDSPRIALIEAREAMPVQRHSITEGTTELMNQPRVVSPSLIKTKDTDAIE